MHFEIKDYAAHQALQLTRFGLKLNFLIPSSKVVFFCFAFSNLAGSSTMSGVDCRKASALPVDIDSLSRDESGVMESWPVSSPV